MDQAAKRIQDRASAPHAMACIAVLEASGVPWPDGLLSKVEAATGLPGPRSAIATALRNGEPCGCSLSELADILSGGDRDNKAKPLARRISQELERWKKRLSP